MSQSVDTRPGRLDPDVREFFQSRRGAFGAMNLLDSHLPPDDRVREIVRNVMTVDYGIARAYGVAAYVNYLQAFADETARSCSTMGLPETARTVYQDHLERLRTLSGGELADAVRAGAGDTMETINLFVPKQCNLSCRGCYAAAVPVATRPYRTELVDDFFSGAVALMDEASGYGARAIYTSGDGEPTIFPRFFDLLEEVRGRGKQWLLFTAGLIFSDEENARQAWVSAREHLRGPSRERIAARLVELEHRGHPRPTVEAFQSELAEYRDHVQIYHSMWSARAAENTRLRRPGVSDYRYTEVSSRGHRLELPSGLIDLMERVFTGEHRGRLGIEMPVSRNSAAEVPAVAAFVVDNGLRSYFEPTIQTGRNKVGDLEPSGGPETAELTPLLVRTLCGFRNVHQPTLKFHSARQDAGFAASPGMGVDLQDLSSMGVLEPLRIGGGGGHGFFAATHSPLMVYANYAHITGCKCDAFAAALTKDRSALAARWQSITQLLDVSGLDADRLVGLLREAGPAPVGT